MIGLIPAESAIIIRLEVILIKLDGSAVISDSSIEVALLTICKASVMIEVCLTRFYLNSSREALDSLVKVTPSVQRDALIVVSIGILRVNLDRSCVVLDCQAELTQLVIGKSSIKKRLEVIRVDFKCLCVKGNCWFIVALFPSCVTFSVEFLSLGLELGINLHLLCAYNGLGRQIGLSCLRTHAFLK